VHRASNVLIVGPVVFVKIVVMRVILPDTSRIVNATHGSRNDGSGYLVDKEIPSFDVAMKAPIFREGAERMVHKFRFLNENGDFVGPKMVAKESRFVESKGSYELRMKFHRDFLRKQALASRLADYFQYSNWQSGPST
jgi:hypothetical protein